MRRSLTFVMIWFGLGIIGGCGHESKATNSAVTPTNPATDGPHAAPANGGDAIKRNAPK